jgi:hypothetical protein
MIQRRGLAPILSLNPESNYTGSKMAKPNYAFEKRQRDLAKKRKKEEKRLRKTDAKDEKPSEDPPQPPED